MDTFCIPPPYDNPWTKKIEIEVEYALSCLADLLPPCLVDLIASYTTLF